MTPERQHKIDRFNSIAIAIFVITLLLFCLFLILPKVWDVDSLTTFFKLLRNILLTISGVAFVCFIVSTFWVSDDEDKKLIKEALRELREEEESKPKRTIFSPDEVKIPLKGLTPEQISVVHKLLQSIPEQNGHIKTSDLVQFLRALKGQGDLDDSDMQRVIVWVEYVTKKSVDIRNFKYDYDNKYSEKGVVKWGNKIRAEYDKIEIS